MFPFMAELTFSDRQWVAGSITANLARVEAITATFGLRPYVAEISRDIPAGIRRLQKSRQLWMMFVAPRLTRDNRLSQQTFTP